MKKRKVTILIIIIGIAVTAGVFLLLIKTDTISSTPFNSIFNIKSSKDKKIVDKVMTWGECLKLYSDKYFYGSPNSNPRPDISKDHKVRVLITEYPNGTVCKNGFYNYGLTCNVFDAETKEKLTSIGFYKDKKE